MPKTSQSPSTTRNMLRTLAKEANTGLVQTVMMAINEIETEHEVSVRRYDGFPTWRTTY